MSSGRRPTIRCPHCGNDGSEGGGWERNWRKPFKVIERMISFWDFSLVDRDGTSVLAIDAGSEKLDPESGEGVEIECNGCFNIFPVPKGVEISFE
ncbi:MAG TPA: hypothetical protein VM557_11105 [Thermoanaerobaculia bacterium]|nr:hypothetical protein [Thermoanaerobaculia bacterium]